MLLKDRKVIVTGGPAREWIDPVRYISNPSTGKMGSALADEAYKRSRETVFIHGHVRETLISGKPYRCVMAGTTAKMLSAVLEEMEDGALLIMAAAPADYTPASPNKTKLKKGAGSMALELKRTPDILMEVSAGREKGDFKNSFVAGFAAETDNLEEYALKKLNEKNLEMICLNDVSRKDAGFAAETNAVTLFFKNGERTELPLLSKAGVAEKILDEIEKRM
jgi:phosphopantothenoylcysteine decarboxylase/phosphopantothenate--cysteine ligase